ncbi:ATP-binding protein [Kitasatospora sp. NPDC004289]
MKKIDVSADVSSLELVNSLVEDLAAEAGLTPARSHLLRLATEELVVNIVVHGYSGSGRGRIGLEGVVTDTEVSIRLTDTAPPFNPFTARPPRGLDLPLHEREPGSLGLYLVNHAVDRSFHEYVHGANHTTIAMRRIAPEYDGRVERVRESTDRQSTQPQRGRAGAVADPGGGRDPGDGVLPLLGTGGALAGRPRL